VYTRSVLDSVTCFFKEDALTYQAPLTKKLFAEERKVAETAAEVSKRAVKIDRINVGSISFIYSSVEKEKTGL